MYETLIRRYHGPTSSIARDIQLQRFRAWACGISATPFRGWFMGLRNKPPDSVPCSDDNKYCRHGSYSGPSKRAIDHRSSPARWKLTPIRRARSKVRARSPIVTSWNNFMYIFIPSHMVYLDVSIAFKLLTHAFIIMFVGNLYICMYLTCFYLSDLGYYWVFLSVAHCESINK